MGWETGTKREFKFDPNSPENDGRWRLYSPGLIVKDSYFCRKSSTAGVSYVMGKASGGPAKGESVIQAVRFDKDKFTEAEASKWWSKNHGRENLTFSDERKKESSMNRIELANRLVKLAKAMCAGSIAGPGIPDGTGPGRGTGKCPFDEEESVTGSEKTAQHLLNVKTLESLTERELSRAIRDAIIAEEGAINQYETVVDSTDNEKVKAVLQEIANEERVHVGELQKLLNDMLSDEQGLLDEGAGEVEDESE